MLNAFRLGLRSLSPAARLGAVFLLCEGSAACQPVERTYTNAPDASSGSGGSATGGSAGEPSSGGAGAIASGGSPVEAAAPCDFSTEDCDGDTVLENDCDPYDENVGAVVYPPYACVACGGVADDVAQCRQFGEWEPCAVCTDTAPVCNGAQGRCECAGSSCGAGQRCCETAGPGSFRECVSGLTCP